MGARARCVVRCGRRIVVALASDFDDEERRLRIECIASGRRLSVQGATAHWFTVLVAPRRLAEELCEHPKKALACLREPKGIC